MSFLKYNRRISRAVRTSACDILVDDPAFHDKHDAPDSGDVLSCVTVRRDQVRLQPDAIEPISPAMPSASAASEFAEIIAAIGSTPQSRTW
jgi:hypothetical protein